MSIQYDERAAVSYRDERAEEVEVSKVEESFRGRSCCGVDRLAPLANLGRHGGVRGPDSANAGTAVRSRQHQAPPPGTTAHLPTSTRNTKQGK
jgi:hypothetical protein